jgi:hypothetical protein
MAKVQGKVNGMMNKRWSKVFWVSIVCAAAAIPLQGQSGGQQNTADTGCVLQKGVYQCDWLAFKQTFAAAKTVSVQTDTQDTHSDQELRRLARHLGKDVIPRSEQPADLTLLLVPLNKEGIYIGPGDENLGTLRVYAGRTTTNPGKLVWAESYRGAKDIPWPSVESYLIQQLETRLKS